MSFSTTIRAQITVSALASISANDLAATRKTQVCETWGGDTASHSTWMRELWEEFALHAVGVNGKLNLPLFPSASL